MSKIDLIRFCLNSDATTARNKSDLVISNCRSDFFGFDLTFVTAHQNEQE